MLGPVETIRHEFGGLDGAILIVRVPPEVNHITADPLRETVLHALPARDDAGVVLDCADVSLITSIGVAALLQIKDHCQSVRAPMCLANVSGVLRTMLTLLKLRDHFKEAPDLDAAIDLVAQGA